MNKTTTVNIGGMVFHIEEHAYEQLNKYLNAIRSSFTTSDGRDEILQDIEGRIAEIFQQRIGTTRQVIVGDDVESVIETMGKPEDLGGSADNSTDTNTDNIHPLKRKLYRDPDDRVLAGVCSGIGHRLGIDPVWLRLIFVIVFFFGGGGLLVYIILAVVVPKAITPVQKLEMRGEPVNVSTLKKESETASVKKDPSFVSRFFDTLGEIFKAIFKFVFYIIAAFFGFIGLVIIFALVMALMAVLGVGGITIPLFISDHFLSQGQQFWAMTSILLLIGVPVIWILYSFIKWIFKLNHSSRPLNITAACLFVVGIIIAFFTGFNVARDFAKTGKLRTTIPLSSTGSDTLYVKLMDNAKYDEENNNIHIGFASGNMSVTTGEDLMLNQNDVRFAIEKSAGNDFELVQVTSARGLTEKEAVENAEKLNYKVEQLDSVLMLNDRFPLPKGVKFRDQEVKIILKVPVGKTVYFDESIEDIIYDIENVTNTWDHHMGGHYWMMTNEGLKCTDHDFTKDDDANIHYDDADQDVNISIDKSGINISGIDTNDVQAKDVKIKIDDNGIHINGKNKRNH